MAGTATASPSISWMLSGYSIEINPRHSKALDAAPDRLDRGTEVFLPWIPGADPLNMVEPAAQLRRGGLVPVPHVGARHLESSAQLEQLAARLAGDAGVDRILIIGGDRSRPAGPYDSSLAVMRAGAFQKVGIRRMAIAGFPEGNPNVRENVLEQALTAKLNFARTAGIQLSMVTQFCFKAGPILSWLQRIRACGIEIPVRIGLAGPASLVTLVRYAARCGIGNSLRVLTEHPSFAKLLTEKEPEPILRGIAEFAAQRKNGNLPLGVSGLHFFPFGGFNNTIDWISAAQTHSRQ
jgi:methylenetetrahydrofolate reductase (NADPH)